MSQFLILWFILGSWMFLGRPRLSVGSTSQEENHVALDNIYCTFSEQSYVGLHIIDLKVCSLC